MKLNNKLLCLFAFVLILTSSLLEATNFHILLVGDTRSDIGEQVVADLRMMREQTVQLSQVLGTTPKLWVFQDQLVSRPNILKTIDNLQVEPGDYLIFYYSGHGVRTDKKRTQWPYFYFPSIDQYLALDEVLDHLKTKQIKFGLVIADCCNNSNSQEWPGMKNFHFQTLMNRRVNPAVRQLFSNSEGLLVISASLPGEFSWASDEGGVLTCALLDAMSHTHFRPAKTWSVIMDEIKHNTRGIQTPQHAFIKM